MHRYCGVNIMHLEVPTQVFILISPPFISVYRRYIKLSGRE